MATNRMIKNKINRFSMEEAFHLSSLSRKATAWMMSEEVMNGFFGDQESGRIVLKRLNGGCHEKK